MIRNVMFSVVLSGLMIYAVVRMVAVYQEGVPERITRIDIYADRISYRTSNYATPSLLSVGLQAAQDPPKKLALHDCSRMDDFEAVVGVLREQGYINIDIELPDDC